MNFLAHIYLSFEDTDLTIGNFIGDFVKGNELDNYSDSIKKGIQLHRAIDSYTDSHEVVQKSKERLRDKYRHYSGVIVDIYYDHFLALHWQEFHKTPLRKFVDETYKLLNSESSRFPAKTKQMLPFMIKHDWLYNYQFFEGIQQVMHGMSRRTKFNSRMDESVVELRQYHDEFEDEFMTFFPDLINFSKEFIQKEN